MDQQKKMNGAGDTREGQFLALRANLLALNAVFEAARFGEAGYALAGSAEEAVFRISGLSESGGETE